MARPKNTDARVHWMSPDGPDSTRNDIVACAIFATVDIRGDRSGTGTMGVHEYVIARRRYQALQGDLVMLPQWPRGSSRIIEYTREEFERLYERLEEEYVRQTNAGPEVLIEEIYGPKATSRIAERMQDCHTVYNRWLEEADQVDFMQTYGHAPMTDEIWDRLCKICNPAPGLAGVNADALTLPVSAEERFLAAQREAEANAARTAAAAEADEEQAGKRSDEVACSIDDCTAFMVENVAGLNKVTAKILARAMRDLKWKTASLPDNVWAKVKNGDNREVRATLTEALAEYLDARDPAPGVA